jgi:ATP-dependent DNA helicase RecG
MTGTRKTPLKQVLGFSQPLTTLQGIGPKRAELLARKGLRTVIDLLYFTPRRYEDRTRLIPLHLAQEGRPVFTKGKIIAGKEERFIPSRKKLFRITLSDQGHRLDLIWFHYKRPYLESLIASGGTLLVYGVVRRNRDKRQIIHPDVTRTDPKQMDSALGHYPVYPSIPGLTSRFIRSALKTALSRHLPDLHDPVPPEILKHAGLPPLDEALKYVHNPPLEASGNLLERFATPCQKRLTFDRFFVILLAIAYRRKGRITWSGPTMAIPPDPVMHTESFFPFSFSRDQRRVIQEIGGDLSSGYTMNRLLQGDVGCGKTAVAAAAARLAVMNGLQVSLMAPTQILAIQHMETFSRLPKEMGFRPVLVTASLTVGQRRDLYGRVQQGHFNLVIGTHALVQLSLVIPKLGLVIIDEQHRFGVRERALLSQKGDHPHLLVMTATPIPRTLALALYGDMAISMIREKPNKSRPVITRLVSAEEKREVYETFHHRLSKGQQAIVICPVIDSVGDGHLKSAVEMAESLKKVLSPPFRIGLLHGDQSPDERQAVMDQFRKRRIHLIVGTTVLEVGIHVPDATVMVVEQPERFGLAQLHQLRGRIGRGRHQGICFLMGAPGLSQKALDRLTFFVNENDGFKIAQKDLETRGQGDLMGLRQSGLGDLDLAEIIEEADLLLNANRAAALLLENDPDLIHPRNSLLKKVIDTILAKPID